MTNEEMFLAIMERLDTLESNLNKRMDALEARMNTMESSNIVEFYAVRREMEVVNESLQQKIHLLDTKIERIMQLKDVEGFEKMKAKVDMLEQGYWSLKEKIG